MTPSPILTPEALDEIDRIIRPEVWGFGSLHKLPPLIASHRALQAQLDAVKWERDDIDKWLSNLLARVHKDGGHLQDAIGTEDACQRADAEIVRLLIADDLRQSAEAKVARLEGVLERLGSMETFTISRMVDHRHDGELLARIDYARQALSPAPETAGSEDEDEREKCFICSEPFKVGDIVLDDLCGETGHLDCFGEDREGFVRDLDTAEPLRPEDPLPKGYAWQEEPPPEPLKMVVGADWLRRKVEADPDGLDCEVTPPHQPAREAVAYAIGVLRERRNAHEPEFVHDAIADALEAFLALIQTRGDGWRPEIAAPDLSAIASLQAPTATNDELEGIAKDMARKPRDYSWLSVRLMTTLAERFMPLAALTQEQS